MLEIEKIIEGKTLEELKPKNENIVYPSERAPYALKLFQEGLRINQELEALEKRKKELVDEYNAIHGL